MISLTEKNSSIIVVGAHKKIIQSLLDFDYIRGASKPSVTAVIGGSRKSHKCWFGDTEILLPVFGNVSGAKTAGIEADWLLNIASANSARKTTEQFFDNYKDAVGAHLFCEGFAEQDALSLIEAYGETKLIAGASGVGLMVPGVMKLGAVGGIFGGNVNKLSQTKGNTAIVCSSGGMVNELIDSLLRAGGAPSFAVSFGGERFPITSPLQWCLQAEADEATDHILYFGELGGLDEYDIAAAIKDGRLKKPVYAYIAGHYDTGEEEVQFGHAKALAKAPDEDAVSKMTALSEVGVHVAKNFSDYTDMIKNLPHKTTEITSARTWQAPETFRDSSMFTSVSDRGHGVDSFVRHTLSTLLERREVSGTLVEFTELVYSLLIDHGSEVSGAVNTMITARAGRDMGTSVASGILTIGDRFGGAINKAANNWYHSVENNIQVEDMLEEHKKNSSYVMGIGHLKYSVHANDPRVEKLVSYAKKHLKETTHLDYAQSVSKRTTQKKTNLILNVDGAVAAIVLDILIEIENFEAKEIEELLRIEFFNSYFIIPRTVGFVGNYLNQARRDEGLFRLPKDQVFYE